MTLLASVLLLFDHWFGQQEAAKAFTLASRLQRFNTATECSILGIVQRTSIRYNRLAEHQLLLESRSSFLGPFDPPTQHLQKVRSASCGCLVRTHPEEQVAYKEPGLTL